MSRQASKYAVMRMVRRFVHRGNLHALRIFVLGQKVIFHCTAEPCHSIRVVARRNRMICKEARAARLDFVLQGACLVTDSHKQNCPIGESDCLDGFVQSDRGNLKARSLSGLPPFGELG